MATTDKQKKLVKILQEMFQLDQSDLDFGIYRIMNTKSKEINAFLENDLLSTVSNAFSSNNNNSIQKELEQAIQQAQSLGADPETLPKVIALREQLSSTTSSNNLENEVFSHLAIFFKRYYKDGDFVSLRRYKKDTYAIPYEGEEVKLHWANSDQHYIKSGEYFRDYTFKIKGQYTGDKQHTIHLKLSDAETQSNNNKATSDKERRFVIVESNSCEVIEDELYINFEYKAIGKGFKQDKLNEEAIAKALESIEDLGFLTALNDLAPTEKNKKRTIFEKHLKSYTSRNSFDYFIHKDLGGFLGRELDFYIKNEMLFLDDIMDSPIKYEEVMGKVKIFKEVSQKIIAFLTQLEELQKKLWEKKKFIIETNYCITLDKIDEDYYEEIFACKEQLAEWQELFDVDVQSIDNLKEEKYLVLDTKFFDMKFKYKFLSEFDNLDEDIDGVLINSENFGALNLLQARYKEQVKTVYIDPPYNTGCDFLYSDSYQHSSWLTFVQDRVLMMKNFMTKSSRFFCSIDDRESNRLLELLYLHLGKENYLGAITWEKRTKSQNTKTSKYMLQSKIEYIHPFRFEDKRQEFNLEVSGQKEYLEEDEVGNFRYQRIEEMSSEDIRGRQTMIYPILDVLPKNGNQWKLGKDTIYPLIDEAKVVIRDNKPYIITRPEDEDQDKHKPFWSHFFDKDTYGTAETGLKMINKDFGFGKDFDTVKPIKLITKLLFHDTDNTQIILDFFAGSGTTGHAIINLNREDNGKRKYILVEMGEYFDSITKPRIQKVIYSDSWKDGKPTTKNGVSQIFKYFKLESYEDTLNNLEFQKTKEQQQALDLHSEAKEDYMLNYSLDIESQGSLLNIDTFSTPFDYKLKIATSSVGETKDTNIDLVETFNYLLGLVVKRIELLKGYLVVEGQNLKKEKILIIWRDGQSSDELNEFFKKMDWSVYDREFDTIFVNGDNNLANLKKDQESFKVKLIEQEFKKLMFNE